MAEDNGQPKKEGNAVEKTVPLGDFIAYKKSTENRMKKLTEDLKKSQEEAAQAKAEAEISKVSSSDDDEVDKVKKYLLDLQKDLSTKKVLLDNDKTSLTKREKEVRAKELVHEYKDKGVEIKIETLLESEDVESKAQDLYFEHLAKENETLKAEKDKPKKEETPESIEIGKVGIIKKQPKDMDEKEFNTYLETERQKALSK